MISLYQNTASGLANILSQVDKATLTDNSGQNHVSNLVGTEIISGNTNITVRVSITINASTMLIITDIKLSQGTTDYLLITGLNIALNTGVNTIVLNLEIPYIT
ncbi:MAG: hypothetical protein DSY42_09730 [Aquifex sp.]|nr:MAG: hypothetical protein DSY42_09730 [Aquifex sp.]